VILIPQGGIRRRPGTKFIDKAPGATTRNTTVPTMPEGGTAADINDGDAGTTATTTNDLDSADPFVIAHYDLLSTEIVPYVDVLQISLSTGTESRIEVQSSDDDVAWTTRQVLPTITTSPQDIRLLGDTARYFRLVKIGAGGPAATVTLGEFNIRTQAGLSEVKLHDFPIERDRQYLCAFTDSNVRIYRDGVRVFDVAMPYTSGDVMDLRVSPTETVMIIVHPDHAPRRLANLNSADDEWVTDLFPFTNVPQFDYNDSSSPTPTSCIQTLTFTGFAKAQQFQIDVEGVLSKNITFAGDSTAAEQSSTAFNIRKNLSEMPNVGSEVAVVRTGALAYQITLSGGTARDYELFSGFPTTGEATDELNFTLDQAGSPREEDVWSATRGWPQSVTFFEGRLWFGGTKSKKQSLFGSRAGLAPDFTLGEAFDDDAIFITLATRTLNDITDVFPGRNLQIFTSGSEFTVQVRPITPASIVPVPQTNHGTNRVQPVDIDGATLFVDRNGKTLRQFLFSFNEDAYVADDLSVLSQELIIQPVDMAALPGTSSDDANWVMVVNTDGSMAVLNTLRSQDINGFTKWTTSGQITAVTDVGDLFYMVNLRTVGGVQSYFIEEWSFDHQIDNGLIIDLGSPGTTVTGLDHLEGATVRVVNDGSVEADKVVENGEITLTSEGQVIQVGLDYTPRFQPMPFSSDGGTGANSMRKKKIVRMNIRVKDTVGLSIDGIPVPVRKFALAANSPLDTPPLSYSGIIPDVSGQKGWGREESPLFTMPDPLPGTVLAIEYEVESP